MKIIKIWFSRFLLVCWLLTIVIGVCSFIMYLFQLDIEGMGAALASVAGIGVFLLIMSFIFLGIINPINLVKFVNLNKPTL